MLFCVVVLPFFFILFTAGSCPLCPVPGVSAVACPSSRVSCPGVERSAGHGRCESRHDNKRNGASSTSCPSTDNRADFICGTSRHCDCRSAAIASASAEGAVALATASSARLDGRRSVPLFSHSASLSRTCQLWSQDSFASRVEIRRAFASDSLRSKVSISTTMPTIHRMVAQ